jgi:hypothetical protein
VLWFFFFFFFTLQKVWPALNNGLSDGIPPHLFALDLHAGEMCKFKLSLPSSPQREGKEKKERREVRPTKGQTNL